MKHILFVCSANQDRSKTADDYFSEKFDDFEFDSAGTNLKLCHQLGTCALTERQLLWADVVFTMEDKHLRFIKKTFPELGHTNIYVLNISDRYSYFQKELIETLKEKVLPLISPEG
jgi:predicted protein tyrosine phosphatase